MHPHMLSFFVLACYKGGEIFHGWLLTVYQQERARWRQSTDSYINRILHFYSPECHQSWRKPNLAFQMFIIIYLFFSDVLNAGPHWVNSGIFRHRLLQRNWWRQVFSWRLALSSHADSKCSALSKYRCRMISYQLFQQFRTFLSISEGIPVFIAHTLLLHSNTLQGIVMHVFMSFKLHILDLQSTFSVIKRGKSFYKSGLFASLAVASSKGTGLQVRKCWGIYFIQGNKHSILLSRYSILIHCGVIAKKPPQLCSFMTVSSPLLLAVLSVSDCRCVTF